MLFGGLEVCVIFVLTMRHIVSCYIGFVVEKARMQLIMGNKTQENQGSWICEKTRSEGSEGCFANSINSKDQQGVFFLCGA